MQHNSVICLTLYLEFIPAASLWNTHRSLQLIAPPALWANRQVSSFRQSTNFSHYFWESWSFKHKRSASCWSPGGLHRKLLLLYLHVCNCAQFWSVKLWHHIGTCEQSLLACVQNGLIHTKCLKCSLIFHSFLLGRILFFIPDFITLIVKNSLIQI